MMQWRREAFGDSSTTVLFGDRPIEQLPRSGTRSRPGDSSHAPASGKSMQGFLLESTQKKSFHICFRPRGSARAMNGAEMRRLILRPGAVFNQNLLNPF